VKYLLDTDHLTFLQRSAAPEHAILVARLAQHAPADCGCSVVSFHEQAVGAHTYLSRARRAQDVVRGDQIVFEIVESFKALPVVPFDAAAGAVFDGLLQQRLRVATMDLRVASIALSRGLTTLTRNKHDFTRVPGVVTEDWTV
jgi:tRNA(fMet)-specific endonuclease VapC